MALVKSGTFGSSPVAAYELHAAQTAGSGNSRTVKVTLKLKVNGSTTASKYGYGLSWIARVKDSYSATTAIKGNEYWYGGEGYREFSQTLTVDVGTTNSTSITVGFQLKRSDGGSTSWNQTITGNFTVDKTNTKPYFPTAQQYINVRQGNNSSGALLSGIIPENISTVYIEWGQASDAEGGTLTYALNHRINGGNWSQIDWGTDRAHSYSIGAGNQGQTLEYYVDAKDDGGLWSERIYSTKITKNTFTGSTLNDIPSIAYNTSSLTLSWNAPSNTTSHADKSKFNFAISCDGLTLYNATASNTATSLTFKIVTSALTDGTPYILKNDLKRKFENSSYKGNLAFTLTSSNAYGSSKTSSKICAVNLQSNPSAVSSASISTDTAKSTCYQKPISSVNNYFFIPDGSKVIRVEWSAVTGNIGEPISYDVYVAYGSEGWSLLQSNLTTTYYNHTVPKQTVSRTVKYRVVTKTSYGTSASKDTAAQTLHYYNAPTITIGAITRASTSATVNVTVTSKTSLSDVTTVGTWTCNNKGTSTVVCSGNLGTSQAAQNLSITGLTEQGQYDLKITYKDNTIFSSNVTTSAISIGQMASVFFVNKYGVGVNGNVATADKNLSVRGSIALTAPNNSYTRTAIKTYNGDGNGMGMAIGSGGMLAIGSGESATGILEETGDSSIMNGRTMATEQTYITSDNGVYFASNCNTIANKKIGVFNNSGNLHVPGAMYVGSDGGTGGSTNYRVYAQNFKPTPADIGALSLSGGTLTGKLQIKNANANTHDVSYLELYRANGARGCFITSHTNGLGIRLHTYDAEGTWSSHYVFNTDGTFETSKLKMGNAFLDSSTLRLEKGYGGNYSQIFFKGQKDDDGRIIHWEDNGSSQLWLMPSDDSNAESDEVIIGSISGKNGVVDMSSGGTWNRSITMNTRGQIKCTSNYPYISFKDSETNHGSHTWCIGSDNGYFYIHSGSRNGATVDDSKSGPLLGCYTGSYTNWRFRGSQLFMNGTSVSTSDINMKENVVSISDVQPLSRNANNNPTPKDFKEFVKNMNFYSYDYLKVNDDGELVSSNSRTFKKQDEKQKKFSEKVYHNIGIVAQDYDYENDPIAKQFIFKDIDGKTLLYNKDALIGILGIALKENIKEVDILKEQIKELIKNQEGK